MIRRKEAGQAIVFTAIGLVMLMGFAGLAVDVGVMRVEKRAQQTAADAAAIAGASNLTPNTGWQAGGQAAATANGFTDGSSNDVTVCSASGATVGTICVQINNPPADGPHAGNAAYVEARVAAVRPTYFMQLLGIPSESVTARAVATNVNGAGPDSGCLWTLGAPSGQIEGVNINGSAILNATTCGITDNGNFNTKGNKLIVNAATFGTAGDWTKSGPGGSVTCFAQTGPCPAINVPASGDPFAAMAPPSQPGASSSCPATGACNVTTSGTQSLQPGTYSSITVGSSSTANFAPGIYYINGSGGLTVNGTSTICNSTSANCSGMPGSANSGVMFYFTGSATVNMTGTPVVQLTGLTSGTYAGMLMYQDPADPTVNGPSLGGNSGANYSGVLYFPADQVTFFGNNNSINVALTIAQSLALSGNPTVNLQGATGLPPGVNILTKTVLVE